MYGEKAEECGKRRNSPQFRVEQLNYLIFLFATKQNFEHTPFPAVAEQAYPETIPYIIKELS